MARIRSIKPEIWQDEKFAILEIEAQLVFIALISLADDFGRLVDNVRLLDGAIFPQKEHVSCRESLATLSRMGMIQRGVTSSRQLIIQVTNWPKHQKVDKVNNKAALPQIVELQCVDSPREAVARESRESRDALALRSTIYDLRSTTNDQRSSIVDRGADDRSRTPSDEPPATAPDDKTPTFRENFSEPKHRIAYEHYRAEQRSTLAFDHEISSYRQGMHGPKATWDQIGQTLHEMLVRNRHYSPASFRNHLLVILQPSTAAEKATDTPTGELGHFDLRAIRLAREGNADWQADCDERGLVWRLEA